MKRENLASRRWSILPVIAATALAGSLALGTPARADVDVRFDIGTAPPAPTLAFHARPHRIYDRRSSVYVIDDPGLGGYDAFQYGGYYWLFNDGYWYRSRSWRGGFQVVAPQYVPTQIYNVPAQRWKNHPSYASWHDRMGGRHGTRNRAGRTRGDRGGDNQHHSQY